MAGRLDGLRLPHLAGFIAAYASWLEATGRDALPVLAEGMEAGDAAWLEGLRESYPRLMDLVTRYIEKKDIVAPSPLGQGVMMRLRARIRPAALAADYPASRSRPTTPRG